MLVQGWRGRMKVNRGLPSLIDVGQPVPHAVLDCGFVRLVDHLGNDASVVRSARVSYGEETKGAAADQKLINFLMEWVF